MANLTDKKGDERREVSHAARCTNMLETSNIACALSSDYHRPDALPEMDSADGRPTLSSGQAENIIRQETYASQHSITAYYIANASIGVTRHDPYWDALYQGGVSKVLAGNKLQKNKMKQRRAGVEG